VDGPHVRNIVIEQVWTPTSEQTGHFYTVAPAVNWTCDPVCGGDLIADMAGSSPLLSRIEVVDGVAIAHEPNVDTGDFGNQTLTAETRLSTFTWPEWGGCASFPPADPTCIAQANVATNQEFRLFVSSFYFLPAPEGWSLVEGDTNPFA
ncbi:MAG TPA: hypothetical protein VHI93_06455, partial [Candidatus Thermoplasmatota archaeon]|nr:hypothetical protein [Candidatus Thermoplasmatota archaeon]